MENNSNGEPKASNFGIHRPKEPIQKGSLSDFLPNLENYTPTIPDAVTSYYMNSSGLNCSDARIVRLISVAAQKFISDIANDALQHCKTKSSSQTVNKSQKEKTNQKKYTLTVEDLAPSLNDFGVVVKKPHYFV